jgi:hypothetical protein
VKLPDWEAVYELLAADIPDPQVRSARVIALEAVSTDWQGSLSTFLDYVALASIFVSVPATPNTAFEFLDPQHFPLRTSN